MPNYRRHYVPGGTYFFTVNLSDRKSDLLIKKIEALRSAVRFAREKRPFIINAWVVLPDHMHCVWTLPDGDSDFSARWRLIKSIFTRQVLPVPGEQTQPRKSHHSASQIWQRRFWEHTIQSEKDYLAHLDYVHINPFKHGLVKRVTDWPYSTFHRYVEQGVYPVDWGGGEESDIKHGAGEL